MPITSLIEDIPFTPTPLLPPWFLCETTSPAISVDAETVALSLVFGVAKKATSFEVLGFAEMATAVLSPKTVSGVKLAAREHVLSSQ